jgi:hypothetical protein
MVSLLDASSLLTASSAGNHKRLLSSIQPFAFAAREPQDQAPISGCQLLIELGKPRILTDQFFIPVMRVTAIKALRIRLFISGEREQCGKHHRGDEPRRIERGSFYLSGALYQERQSGKPAASGGLVAVELDPALVELLLVLGLVLLPLVLGLVLPPLLRTCFVTGSQHLAVDELAPGAVVVLGV